MREESRGKKTKCIGRWKKWKSHRGERRPVRMIGWQLYPLSQVSEEVSGNRCRYPFAKHGPVAPARYLDIRNFSSLSGGSSFSPYIKSHIPLHESSIRLWNVVVQISRQHDVSTNVPLEINMLAVKKNY